MHYMILWWNPETLKWDQKHYSHNYEDFERMSKIYPVEEGYKHMIDMMFLNTHEVVKKVKEFKDRMLQK